LTLVLSSRRGDLVTFLRRQLALALEGLVFGFPVDRGDPPQGVLLLLRRAGRRVKARRDEGVTLRDPFAAGGVGAGEQESGHELFKSGYLVEGLLKRIEKTASLNGNLS